MLCALFLYVAHIFNVLYITYVLYMLSCLTYPTFPCAFCTQALRAVRYLYTFMVFLTLNKTAEKAYNFYFVWYISDYIIFCDDNKCSLMQHSTQCRQWGKGQNFSWRKERSIIGKILEIKKQFSYLQGKIFFSILVNLFLEW